MAFVVGLVFGAVVVIMAVRARRSLGPIGSAVDRLIGANSTVASRIPEEIRADIERDAPNLARMLRAEPSVPVEEIPAEVKQEDLNAIREGGTPEERLRLAKALFKNHDLAAVLAVLATWRPRLHKAEEKYQQSFKRHFTKHGYDGRVTETPPLDWAVTDDDEIRTARPDFLLGDAAGPEKHIVLVELKADITSSSNSDRALGQMLRYLLAWQHGGPALLVVGGKFAEGLRSLIRWYVSTWRTQWRLPVAVHFLRDKQIDDDAAYMPDEDAA